MRLDFLEPRGKLRLGRYIAFCFGGDRKGRMPLLPFRRERGGGMGASRWGMCPA